MDEKVREESPDEVARGVEQDLRAATDARKCHFCGCFHDAVAAIEGSVLAAHLEDTFRRAREVVRDRRYDCLGCAVCWPARALDLAGAVTDLPVRPGCCEADEAVRAGWPPFPGDYRVVRYTGSVAVCTLHPRDLARRVGPFGGEFGVSPGGPAGRLLFVAPGVGGRPVPLDCREPPGSRLPGAARSLGVTRCGATSGSRPRSSWA